VDIAFEMTDIHLRWYVSRKRLLPFDDCLTKHDDICCGLVWQNYGLHLLVSIVAVIGDTAAKRVTVHRCTSRHAAPVQAMGSCSECGMRGLRRAMPRRSKNAAVAAMETVIENHVAGRIRLRRGLLGMSQSDLAKALGITFQQVQKYERGSNRVSVGKLYRLADILDVPLTFFFDGLDVPDMRRPPETFAATAEGSSPILSRRELDLLRAWKTAPEEIADAVGSLLRAISPNAGYDEEAAAASRAAAAAAAQSPAAVAPPQIMPVDEAPPPRRRGPVPGSKRNTAANSTAANSTAIKANDGRRRRGAVWDPADIRDYNTEKE